MVDLPSTVSVARWAYAHANGLHAAAWLLEYTVSRSPVDGARCCTLELVVLCAATPARSIDRRWIESTERAKLIDHPAGRRRSCIDARRS